MTLWFKSSLIEFYPGVLFGKFGSLPTISGAPSLSALTSIDSGVFIFSILRPLSFSSSSVIFFPIEESLFFLSSSFSDSLLSSSSAGMLFSSSYETPTGKACSDTTPRIRLSGGKGLPSKRSSANFRSTPS